LKKGKKEICGGQERRSIGFGKQIKLPLPRHPRLWPGEGSQTNTGS